jgi:Na+-translocating ferredoxin:NAD+ oxidoreductase RnfG subunit
MSVYEGTRLGLVKVLMLAAACAVALSLTHELTRDTVAYNRSQQVREALARITDPARLPAVLPDLSAPPLDRQLCDGTRLIHTAIAGYGGPIHVLATIRETPRRTGRVTVTVHRETPGIVDFLGPASPWLDGLEDRTAAGLADVDAVSGATITSRAVLDGLSGMLALESAAAPIGECPP